MNSLTGGNASESIYRQRLSARTLDPSSWASCWSLYVSVSRRQPYASLLPSYGNVVNRFAAILGTDVLDGRGHALHDTRGIWRLPRPCLPWARIAGHRIAISSRYVHPSEDTILAALSRLGGHNSGHTAKSPQLRSTF